MTIPNPTGPALSSPKLMMTLSAPDTTLGSTPCIRGRGRDRTCCCAGSRMTARGKKELHDEPDRSGYTMVETEWHSPRGRLPVHCAWYRRGFYRCLAGHVHGDGACKLDSPRRRAR